MGTNWLCLTATSYNSAVPSEVLAYYNQVEGTTWADFASYLVSQKLAKWPRGPITLEEVPCYFVNIEVDKTDVMSTAIDALEAVAPIGYQHSTKQMESLMGQQYYIGSLTDVNTYMNLCNSHEASKSNSSAYLLNGISYANAIENYSDNTEYAIIKHHEVDANNLNLTLHKGALPSNWFPPVENI